MERRLVLAVKYVTLFHLASSYILFYCNSITVFMNKGTKQCFPNELTLKKAVNACAVNIDSTECNEVQDQYGWPMNICECLSGYFVPG